MINEVTHAHLGSIWYHSEPSDIPYSPNQFLGWDFFAPSYSKTARVMWWAQSAPLVKIGLTELPKSGRAPPSGVPVMEELPRKSILAPLNTVGKRQACQIQIGSLVHFKGQTKLTLTVYSTILFYSILFYSILFYSIFSIF